MATKAPKQAPRNGGGGGGGGGTRVPTVRTLRVGVALGDHFIDERLFRSRENITVGQSAKNTFSIPIENLPKSWPLFTVENGRYVLHFTEGMDGRLSDGQNVYTFDTLKGRGAERRGDHWAVPLVETSRGKVELGQMKLLFQFVTAPPVQPRPRLPASVRGNLADRIDPVLAVIMGASILIHFAIALYALSLDREVYSKADNLYREFQSDTFKDKVIATTVEVQDTGTETTTTEQGGNEQPSEKPSSGGNTDKPASGNDDGGGDDSAPDDATIAEAIQDSALIAAITGGEDPGGRYGRMNETDQGADLNKALENAKGKDIGSIGSGGGRKTRGPDTGKIGSGAAGGEVKGPGSGEGTVGKKEEEKVSRASFDPVEDLTESTLDPDQVAKIIRSRYLQGIKRCHQRLLKQNPSARGRVTVRFTVGPTGGVTKSSVKGFDPTVDACIKGLTTKWRFGAPKDEDGKPTSADFEIPFMLEPG
ncbi:MAG TPA: AgmX/PglI C-terminal domain-containing protein [Kofleriaceae bacterium]|nr:AgmX/PglI C-terminal domain-containing protein [Kofleriaceae bacterium]